MTEQRLPSGTMGGDSPAPANRPSLPRAAVYLVLRTEPAGAPGLAALEAFVHASGFVAVALYREHARDLPRRPALRKLLKRARTGALDVVCVPTLGSLGRSPASVLRVALELHAAGVRVVSAAQPWFDLQHPLVDWLLRGERSRAKRSAEAIGAKRARGERTGEIPFGSQLAADGRRLEPNDHEQTAVERMKVLAAQRVTRRSIAAILASDGYVSRSGRPLTHRQVGRILDREVPRPPPCAPENRPEGAEKPPR